MKKFGNLKFKKKVDPHFFLKRLVKKKRNLDLFQYSSPKTNSINEARTGEGETINFIQKAEMKAATTLNYYEQLVNEEKEKFDNLLQEVKAEAEERKKREKKKNKELFTYCTNYKEREEVNSAIIQPLK
jgi:hypothetical protein